jgi:acyl dehydratase
MTRVYEQPPSPWRALLAAWRARDKPPTVSAQPPTLEARLLPRRAEPAHLARYRALCGFANDGRLPLTYPQVLAGPLHVAMFTDPQFPLAAMGAVHVRNVIEQQRPLPDDALFDLTVRLVAVREVSAGVEADVETVATVHGEAVWRSVLTALQRGKATRHQRGAPAQAEVLPPALRSLLVRVPADLGRRYAGVAGDWNPIHQTAWAAKLFGFPRAIAHGMWTLARTLAELQDEVDGAGGLRCEVQFKRPVWLPSRVLLRGHRLGGGVEGRVQSLDGNTLHCVIQIVPLDSARPN